MGGDWPLFQRSFADLGVTADKKYLVAADDEGTIKVAEIEKRNVVVIGQGAQDRRAGGVRVADGHDVPDDQQRPRTEGVVADGPEGS